jgi:hypothetical protein
MSKRTRNNLTVVTGAPAPAVAGTLGNILLPFVDAARVCDRVVARQKRLAAAVDRMLPYRGDAMPSSLSVNASINELLPGDAEVTLSEPDLRTIEQAAAMLAKLNPPELYEDFDEGVLRREVVAHRIGLMLGAFPGTAPGSAEIFVSGLLAHTETLSLSYLALQTGCAQVERRRATLPSIAVVMAALEEHEERWSDRRSAVDSLIEMAALARDDLVQLRQRLADHIEAERCRRAIWHATNHCAYARHRVEVFRAGLMRIEAERENAERDLAAAEAKLAKAEHDLAAAKAEPVEGD